MAKRKVTDHKVTPHAPYALSRSTRTPSPVTL